METIKKPDVLKVGETIVFHGILKGKRDKNGKVINNSKASDYAFLAKSYKNLL